MNRTSASLDTKEKETLDTTQWTKYQDQKKTRTYSILSPEKQERRTRTKPGKRVLTHSYPFTEPKSPRHTRQLIMILIQHPDPDSPSP